MIKYKEMTSLLFNIDGINWIMKFALRDYIQIGKEMLPNVTPQERKGKTIYKIMMMGIMR